MTTNKKHYKLIVGHDFSLANETDADIMTDYSPGIWAIGTQKRAMKYAQELLAEGHTIAVTDYNNPRYHTLANQFIKELNIKQELFPEPAPVAPSVVTNGRPSNLSQLKKYLTVGMKVHVKNFYGSTPSEKDTSVIGVQTTSVILEKVLGGGQKSWYDLGKASEWQFTNDSARRFDITREGENKLVYEIIYIN